MKICFQVGCLILTSLMVATDCYADSYGLQGELYFDDLQANAKWTRGIKLKVVSETPVIIKQGKHIVSLVFNVDPPPSKNYSLTVSLMTNPKSDDEIRTTFFTKTYQSTLVGGSNGPFEFEVEQNEFKFGGALGLVLRQKR